MWRSVELFGSVILIILSSFRIRLPFDVSTVSGYIYTVIIQEIMPFTFYLVTVPIESLFLSMGLFMGAFHTHYRLLLQDINELVDTGSTADSGLRIELKTRLIKAIDLHYRAQA